jgi:hypothetical protein
MTLCKNCGVPVEVRPSEFLGVPFREAFFKAQEVNLYLVGIPGLTPNRGLCEYCDPNDPYFQPEEVWDAAIEAVLDDLL